MDSEQYFGYRLSGQGSAYSSSHPHIPLIPTRLIESLKFEARDSPNSPFLTTFDSETFTTLSDSREKYGSTSGASPSSLDDSSSFNQSGSSAFVQSDGVHYIKNALQDIETTLMAPDEEVSMPMNPLSGENRWTQAPSQMPRRWTHEPTSSNMVQPQAAYTPSYDLSGHKLRTEKRQKSIDGTGVQMFQFPSGSNNLKQLLIACASALAANKLDEFAELVEHARASVSISGDPIQRLGAYMVEGLVARKESSGNNIYRTLKCREPEGKDLLSYMHILYEICPYLKFGYMAANGAIAEACRNEDRIHIIDFQIAQGTQWMTLLQALAARPGGAPHVRITGIDDPVSKYARGDTLELVGKRLQAVSQKFNIPVEFQPLSVYAPYVTKEMLDVRPDEALAVNFPLQLHHMPDESVDLNNPRDERLRMVKSLSPKVVTIVEQESNTNTAAFFPRFLEVLDYYFAMFESMDTSLPRDKKERINVEQHCLARDIVNIIACEGKERVERHELFMKWRSRLTMAGFAQYPLSPYVNSVIRNLLKCYSDHYTLVEKDGAMLLGWKDRNLISASAWN